MQKYYPIKDPNTKHDLITKNATIDTIAALKCQLPITNTKQA